MHRRQEVNVFCNDCMIAVCQICLERNHANHYTKLENCLNATTKELKNPSIDKFTIVS
ncbi:uncharacterized protein LOC130012311, partial [Patella vulgata]|uniref:uncharacterized protein LOC130012311 n=1 Tax=Patella vulgata TaxID=6465 RepID=UPI0024A7CADC